MIVIDNIRRYAISDPDSKCISDSIKTLSFKAFFNAVETIASALSVSGASSGDRIAICMPNCVDYVIVMYACLEIGATFVPVPYKDPTERKRQMCSAVKPKLVIVETLTEIEESLEWAPASRGLVASDLMTEHPSGYVPASDDQRLAYIVFTSGSTGTPKGACISADSLDLAISNTRLAFSFSKATKALAVSSFHFDGSFGSLFGVPSAGGCVYIQRDVPLFPPTFHELVETLAITHTSMSPTYMSLLNRVGRPKTNLSLMTIGLGGEDCSKSAILKFKELFPRVSVFNRYGPTESAIAVATYEIIDRDLSGQGKVPIGKPANGVRFFILNGDVQKIEPGVSGELLIAGAQLMSGYWDAPEETAAALRSDLIAGEIVYRTGDMVTVNSEGNVVYLARSNNVINRNGVRIGLTEVSSAMEKLPAVEASFCLDFYNGGDSVPQIIGFVQLCESNVSEIELKNNLRELLPSYMLPDRILAIDEFPINSSGKIDATQLRLQYQINCAAG